MQKRTISILKRVLLFFIKLAIFSLVKIRMIYQRLEHAIRIVIRLIIKAVQKVSLWFRGKSEKGNYDLSLVDEVFGFLFSLAIAAALRAADWGQSYDLGIAKILALPALMLILILVAINRSRFGQRALFFLLGLSVATINTKFLMWLSKGDLHPQENTLHLLPAGVICWFLVREAAQLLLNILDKKRSVLIRLGRREREATPTEKNIGKMNNGED